MNTPVNPELAKLLAEKKIRIKCLSVLSYEEAYYLHPTIAEVVMELYEKFGIWIWVEQFDTSNEFEWVCRYENEGDCKDYDEILYKSPKEAYEAAIKYCLTDIIK